MTQGQKFYKAQCEISDGMKEAQKRREANGYDKNKYIRGLNDDAVLFYPTKGIFTYRDNELPLGFGEAYIGGNDPWLVYDRAVYHLKQLEYIRYVKARR